MLQKSCLLLTLHYIDQICMRMPFFTLSSLTCHRFIISAIAVASKGLCDTFCTNNLYAKVGGITVTELNMLEREFLQAIDWRLTVSNYSSYCSTPWRIEYHSAVGSDGSFFIGCLFMVEPFLLWLLVHTRSPPGVLCQPHQDQ